AALVAGNTVIIKSAEQTPYVAHRLVEILHRVGVPKDALIHLPGTGETVGRALVASPEVDMVAFTGSREVGIEISRIAAGVELTKGGIKHVVAEMGGKNPIVVFADADLEEAALAILTSAFGHAGQKCSAASRVLVERSIHRELADLLVEGARSMALGPASEPGTAINPVIDDTAAARVREWVGVARCEGASLLDHQEKAQAGTLLGPVVVSLEGSRAGAARIAREEIFGPVLALLPFDTTEEAITLANSTEYALTAGVFSRSPARVRQMVQGLRAGNVYVNREITGARVGIEPFGGWGLSGTGPKAGGPEYLHAFITRRDYPDSGQTAEVQDAPAVLAETPSHLAPVQGEIGVIPWSVSPITRAEVIMRLLTLLSEERSDIQQALTTARATDERTPAQRIAELRALGASLAGRITEIMNTEPTMPVPGQHTYTRWDEPRGSGLITVDESASPAELFALMLGGLLACNGIVVTVPPSLAQVAKAFTRLLHHARVPSSSLRYQANGSATAWLAEACRLAAEPIAFAGISVREETARRLAQVLAAPWPEQRWLKAMISLTDGPLPWEDGFLRRFALPKTVAIRTLRHGADLVFV
ncbi:MAG TPA: aldehyde dehydrogenase family protein, partial [Chloroflexota bacterium]|nr:aldehyde dehydrogenase family protein [Chloroflexota bacterium]